MNVKYIKLEAFSDYKKPYIESTLLIYELINLEHKIVGTNVRINEKSGMRKDRYSSLAYN